MSDIREQVKEYYSNLKSSGDLKTEVCTCGSAPKDIQAIINELPTEICERFYGCGSPIPPMLEGCTVLDLGCGTGRDVFVCSKLVGETGKVIGVDMNEDQLAVGEKYKDEVAKTFGYAASNIEFKHGYIEDLKSLGIEDSSIDVVISNCVINLSPFKEAVFSEIWRVLTYGGELYFSDVFADRRMPAKLAADPVLRGECISGAMYIEDFRRLMRKVGWEDFRYMSTRRSTIGNDEIAEKVKDFTFFSRTVRAFKIPDKIEDLCEQYNQVATYQGTIPGMNQLFDLDDHHRFFTDQPLEVCGNSCAMVEDTRYGKAFKIEGNRDVHYGPFPGCGNIPYSADGEDAGGCCGGGCCCQVQRAAIAAYVSAPHHLGRPNLAATYWRRLRLAPTRDSAEPTSLTQRQPILAEAGPNEFGPYAIGEVGTHCANSLRFMALAASGAYVGDFGTRRC